MSARGSGSIAGGALRALAGVLCVLVCGVSLGSASAAAAQSKFGSNGENTGQFSGPSGVAVDQASGDLYVADQNNSRVAELEGSGSALQAWGWGVTDGQPAFEHCTSICYRGLEGAGAGELDEPQGVAVDNDPLSLSYGDVYVVDARNHRVEKFSATGTFLLAFGGEVNATKDAEAGAGEAEKNICTAASGDTCKEGTTGTGNGQFGQWPRGSFIAVDATGTVYVGDENRVQEFAGGGEYLAQIALAGAGEVKALALDASGDLYITSSLGGVGKYSPAGTLLETLDATGVPVAVAVSAAGEVCIIDEQGKPHVQCYSPAGAELASFGEDTVRDGSGIAFDEATGELYLTSAAESDTGVWVLTEPGPGPLVEVGSEQSSEAQPTSVALAAQIDPEGAETTYRFEYGTSEAYGSSTAQSASLGSGFVDGAASVSLSGLTPATTYHYRVVATSAAGTSFGPDQTFTTLPPASIDSESVAALAATSVTLQAQIDPLGSATTYHFEYGTSTTYGTSTPMPAGELGSGDSDVGVTVHLQSLAPSTLYHYRVVTSNVLGVADGSDHTFVTQAGGGKLTLPDDRQWEMVSPLVKDGAQLVTDEDGLIQASADGGAIAYLSRVPLEANPAGNAAGTEILSTREAGGGWSSRGLATPHDAVVSVSAGAGVEYRLFSTNLALGLVEPFGSGEPPLSAKATERTMYIRNDAPLRPALGQQALYREAEAEALPGAHGAGYLPLVTPANVAPGVEFGGKSPDGVHFEGATPDLSHVVLHSKVSLTAPAAEGGLYEWSGGRLAPVSVLPGSGEEVAIASLGGSGGNDVRNAISADGSRVFWSSGGHLYLRDTVSGETLQVDSAQGAPEPSAGAAVFELASADGSKVFFEDPHRLTPNAAGTDLYELEVNGSGGPLSGTLTDLTVTPNPGEEPGLQGVLLGASEDGSYLYFAANGVLAEGAAPGSCELVGHATGTCNLYVMHDGGAGWTTKFIATLENEDSPDWQGGFGELVTVTSRVSPNGRYLAFMSDRSLTGYDNHDANSGVPDEEVYRYDASAGRLVCASCNPTGARPVGMDDTFVEGTSLATAPLIDSERIWANKWLAANLPGWTPRQLTVANYQSRYLSDNGRLFFNGVDALVPQAANGVADVYEYEPAEQGSCTTAAATFSTASNGCVALISGASSGAESVFLDASEDGNDVFFLTAARLAPQDLDNALDVYDAHVCAGGLPCPAVTVPAPACTTADSCRAAPAPQPSLFGAPASATFSGAGNLAAPPTVKSKQSTAKRKGKGKAKRKAKGKRRGKPKTKGKHQARGARKARGRHRGRTAKRGGGGRQGYPSARGRGSAQGSGASSSSAWTGR